MSKPDKLDEIIDGLKKDSHSWRAIYFVVLVFVLMIFWMLWGAASRSFSGMAEANGTIQEAGSWGDSFGGFNALVSALGFAAVLSTLILQNVSLREQQNDQHLIRFETSFFELLKLMRELRSELTFKQSDEMILHGPIKLVRKTSQSNFNAIKYACYEVRVLAYKDKAHDSFSRNEISKIYSKSVHNRYESRFAPYFRIIYTILHKIKEDSKLSDSQKAYYGNLLRAQLTSHEIALLGFNATAVVAKDLDEHLIYFRMFKYLPDGPARTMLLDVYPAQAFAART